MRRTHTVLVLLALTTLSCATSSGQQTGPHQAAPLDLSPPKACTVELPPLKTWAPSPDAVKLRLTGRLSSVKSEWVVPFHGLLLSSELRAREVERRKEQEARVVLALRLRSEACKQWEGRTEVLLLDGRWLSAEVERLRVERKWILFGAGGGLFLVALVAVAGG